MGTLSLTKAARALFWLAVVVEGASVMLIEILGTRLIGPVFGVGLYVWSALITVTLGALALGYALGGVWADKQPTFKLFYGVLAAAGAWLALLPLLSSPILMLASPFGLRFGPIAASLLLFGPVLTLLGMMSPMAIRLQCSQLTNAGRSAGRVYATSTIAGVASATTTGYLLIPQFAVANLWLAAGGLLLVVASAGLFVRGSGPQVLALPLFAFIGTFGSLPELGKETQIIEQSQSAYAKLSVVEDTSHSVPLRLLRADHSFIGAEWANSGQPAFAFLHLMEALKWAYPEGKSLLLLGLGVGSLPMSMAGHGVTSDVVEIDGEVVRLAEKHFRFDPPGEVFVEDARTFVRRATKSYDFIVHDTFTGGSNPAHLLSLEMMNELRARLTPKGVALVNLVGCDAGPLATAAIAVNRTVRAAFAHVRVFRDGPGGSPDQLSNLIFFASAQPLVFQKPSDFQFEGAQCEKTLSQFQAWETLKEADQAAPIIRDAENPLSRLSLPVSENFHHHIGEMYPPAFWVN